MTTHAMTRSDGTAAAIETMRTDCRSCCIVEGRQRASGRAMATAMSAAVGDVEREAKRIEIS